MASLPVEEVEVSAEELLPHRGVKRGRGHEIVEVGLDGHAAVQASDVCGTPDTMDAQGNHSVNGRAACGHARGMRCLPHGWAPAGTVHDAQSAG